MAETKKSVFETLNAINCNEHTEQKNGLTYLSWAWAWQMVKTHFPDAFYTIYEREGGIPYFTDGKTAWVKTGVTICGLEHIEYLPVMDNRNNSIPLERITSFDMNKAIQRSLTKAVARHGLGLYIYAGEDLPAEESETKKANDPKPAPAKKTPSKQESKPATKADPKDYLPGGKYYATVIERSAKNQPTKSGETMRDFWVRTVGANEDMMEAFDHDVATYRLNNNIQPAF